MGNVKSVRMGLDLSGPMVNLTINSPDLTNEDPFRKSFIEGVLKVVDGKVVGLYYNDGTCTTYLCTARVSSKDGILAEVPSGICKRLGIAEVFYDGKTGDTHHYGEVDGEKAKFEVELSALLNLTAKNFYTYRIDLSYTHDFN